MDSPRGGEGVAGELRGLADLAHLPPARAGAGDGDRHIREIRREARRPGIAFHVDHRDLAAGGAPPFLRGELRDRTRGFTLHQHLHVVDGPVGAPVRLQAQFMLRRMVLYVPSIHGEIDAADEGNAAVDGDDLLMLRSERGVI